MADQAGALTEPLAAVGALVRLFSRVNPLMLLEDVAVAEALPTDGTFVGLLARVRPVVLDQVGAATEALPTLGAPVGLLARVGPLVDDQVGGVAEAFPALATPVGPLARVRPQVLNQVRAAAEALAALRAFVRLLPGVGPPVNPQMRAVTEAFPTFSALVGFVPGGRMLLGRGPAAIPGRPAPAAGFFFLPAARMSRSLWLAILLTGLTAPDPAALGPGQWNFFCVLMLPMLWAISLSPFGGALFICFGVVLNTFQMLLTCISCKNKQIF